jgi:ADP-L-glycero-D-manno-heptose 6-epimerase
MSVEPRIDYVDMPDSIRDQYQYYTEANMDKLRSVGYETPFVPLEEAVKDYVQNYLSKGEFLSGQS